MSTIHYNSHATKIALVMDGRGHLQISCPHMSSRSDSKHDKSSPSYHRISADLKPGMVFVVPPGHPFVTIASNKENLLIICFEVNVRDNKKFTFAGRSTHKSLIMPCIHFFLTCRDQRIIHVSF